MSDLRGLRLGAFVLEAPIARGAMGAVWRATHAVHGGRAAVKVVADATPRLAAYLQAEIRAAASLDHPSIVQLYDAGELDAPASGLPAGTPWLAMELLAGGSLLQADLDWPLVRRTLRDLLSALAHAHAAGVLHRDIKPDNVLFDGLGNLRLCDFGLGVRPEDEAGIRPSGTPLWMAPEQYGRDAWRLGPWTDLYAVGCVAWWMVTGVPPFSGDDPAALRRAHAEQPLPPLHARFDVPAGLDDWIARMMEKAPGDRFRRAADALTALGTLVDPSTTSAPVRRAPTPDMATLVPSGLGSLSFDPTTTEDGAVEPVSLPSGSAGLGLVRLREAPLRGRAREMARLRQIVDEAAGGRPRVVVLRGPSGSGKTRLAAWLCREVHATGRGTPFRAAHAPGHGDGAAGLLARALRIEAGDRPDVVRERIEAAGLPSPYALAEILRPTATGSLGLDRAGRDALIARALGVLAEDRLPLVWIDDAQWGADACALAEDLAARDEGWLVVLGVRSDVPVQPEAAAILDRLPAVTFDLGSLRTGDALDLVGGLASLDPATRLALVRHTGGSPLFLVELVGEWIGRGLLEPTPSGFRLRDERDAWPADRTALWRARLLRVLAADEAAILPMLATAAALGAEVDADELARACASAGGRAPSAERTVPAKQGTAASPEDVVRRLVAERLAVPDPAFRGRRWSFVHGSLREGVLALAQERGLLPAAHRACAAMLEADGPASGLRRAAHLEAAGDLGGAVDALLAARAWLIRRDVRESAAAADRAALLLERMPPDPVRRGLVAVARARVAVFRSDYDEASRWVDVALACGDRGVRALALVDRGRVRRLRHEIAPAIEDYAEAVRGLETLGDAEQLSVALGELSIGLREAHRFEEADAAVRRAIECTGDAARRAELSTLRVSLAILAGDFTGALAILEELDAATDWNGLVYPRAQFLYHRAYARAGVGAFVGAESDAMASVHLRYGMGSRALGWVELAVALRVALERYDDAEALLREHAVERDEQASRVRLSDAALAARRGDWDVAVGVLEAPLTESFVPALVEALYERAAALADAGGRDDVARLARRRRAEVLDTDEAASA